MNSLGVIFALLALGFGPAVFWLYYFYKKDSIEPEPLSLIRAVFLWGMFSVGPAILLENAVPAPPIAGIVIVAPIVEEALKFLVVYLVVYNHIEFDEPMDGVVYASAAALGFASLENLLYLGSEFYSPKGQPYTMAVLRAFLSVPAHALMSICWGYALGVAKFSEKGKGTGIALTGLGTAILAHGGFNFVCSLGPLWMIGMLILTPFMWGPIHSKIHKAHLVSPHLNDLQQKEIRKSQYHGAEIIDPKWFDNRVVAVLLLFTLAPVGMYALYKNSRFSLPEKLAIMSIWLVATGLLTVNYAD